MIGIARAGLEQLNGAMRLRDPAAAGLFVEDALLVGSDPGEIAHGRPAIAKLLAAIHARDYVVQWQFDMLRAGGGGDRAWLFGEGHAVLERPTGATRIAYRLSGALLKTPEGWRWELFHGSEPAA
ncbi:MAG: hypothetical protein JWQ89_2100 [Devosia sp.]|uniref:nuclear transport factor 2 family protein n=1 Tax=Devosia sp. TaxID=1871048 RepID=UPI0026024763|nr:nuclear transport factor 2 family protein [Devosia sp.]MDB5540373.1 hypothetical protein [Devosia sp.]